jgi:glycosyltransferase involved in cell wall biosynthesis
VKPRILIVGRLRYTLPLDVGQSRRFAALSEQFEWRVLASASQQSAHDDERFVLLRPQRPRVLDGLVFHATLPIRLARELKRFRPDVVLVQGAHETAEALVGRALARSRARIVLDVQGDWRTATTLYGSPARRLLTPLADRIASLALRRADAVRTISPWTTELVAAHGVQPTAEFPAFVDYAPFRERDVVPLPDRPQAVYVGALEPVKDVATLARAWRLAAPRVPEARLLVVGDGSQADLVRQLVADFPGRVEWRGSQPAEEVLRAIDESTLLVLPSKSEGFGRVVVEGFSRARGAVVSSAVKLVEDGVTGLVVEPQDAEGLADALVRVLSDPELARQLGEASLRACDAWVIEPQEFARRMRRLVDDVLKA